MWWGLQKIVKVWTIANKLKTFHCKKKKKVQLFWNLLFLKGKVFFLFDKLISDFVIIVYEHLHLYVFCFSFSRFFLFIYLGQLMLLGRQNWRLLEWHLQQDRANIIFFCFIFWRNWILIISNKHENLLRSLTHDHHWNLTTSTTKTLFARMMLDHLLFKKSLKGSSYRLNFLMLF